MKYIFDKNLSVENIPDFEFKQIKKDWFLSYRTKPECKNMDFKVYKKNFNIIINSILKKAGIKIDLIFKDEILIGWICKENDFIHYLYVKKMYRDDEELKNKLFEIIKDYDNFECTFISRYILNLCQEKSKKVHFNPFLRFK